MIHTYKQMNTHTYVHIHPHKHTHINKKVNTRLSAASIKEYLNILAYKKNMKYSSTQLYSHKIYLIRKFYSKIADNIQRIYKE